MREDGPESYDIRSCFMVGYEMAWKICSVGKGQRGIENCEEKRKEGERGRLSNASEVENSLGNNRECFH